MNYEDITEREIDSVCEWYAHAVDKDVSKLKTKYWKKKGENLRRKLGWKFDVILAEIVKSFN